MLASCTAINESVSQLSNIKPVQDTRTAQEAAQFRTRTHLVQTLALSDELHPWVSRRLHLGLGLRILPLVPISRIEQASLKIV